MITEELQAAGQHAVAESAGTETCALTSVLSYSMGTNTVLLDIKNAYNATSRAAAGRAVAKHLPHLLPYFTATYRTSRATSSSCMRMASSE